MDNDINTISIVQSRLPEAVDALEKLNKKAVRYGAEPVTWTLGEPREEKVRTQDGREVKVMYVDLTLSHRQGPQRVPGRPRDAADPRKGEGGGPSLDV